MTTALVTGATRGLGLEVARQLAGCWPRVWIGARDETRGEQAGETVGGKFVLLDVTDEASIAVGDGAVWALTCCERRTTSGAWAGNHLLKINPITLHVERTLALPNPVANGSEMAVGAGEVWTEGDDSVTKIDPSTMKIIRTFPLSEPASVLCDIAATRRQLWVSSGDKYCGTVGR